MKDEKVIEYLEQAIHDCSSKEDEPFKEAFGTALLVFKENKKLKTDITALRERNRVYALHISELKNTCHDLRVEMNNLKG